MVIPDILNETIAADEVSPHLWLVRFLLYSYYFILKSVLGYKKVLIKDVILYIPLSYSCLLVSFKILLELFI